MTSDNEQNILTGTTLVLGGARSGKSVYAEQLVSKSGLKPVYLATARADDQEMEERIELHKKRRDRATGQDWTTIEEPLALGDALSGCAYTGRAVLVDCLTLWITNLMMADADVEREITNLVRKLGELAAPVVLVSNEVGLGITPDNEMARRFVDLAGTAHQKLGAVADQVFLVSAGLPLKLKPSSV